MTKKFQKPRAYMPPNPQVQRGMNNSNGNLGKRRRPLQPGELLRKHYGQIDPSPTPNQNHFFPSQPPPASALHTWRTHAPPSLQPQPLNHPSHQPEQQQFPQLQPQRWNNSYHQLGPRGSEAGQPAQQASAAPAAHYARSPAPQSSYGDWRRNNPISNAAVAPPTPLVSNAHESVPFGPQAASPVGPFQVPGRQFTPVAPGIHRPYNHPNPETHPADAPGQIRPLNQCESPVNINTTMPRPATHHNEFVRNSFDPSSFYGLEDDNDDGEEDGSDDDQGFGQGGWAPKPLSNPSPDHANTNAEEVLAPVSTNAFSNPDGARVTPREEESPNNDGAAITATSATSNSTTGKATMTKEDLLNLFGGIDASQSQDDDDDDDDDDREDEDAAGIVSGDGNKTSGREKSNDPPIFGAATSTDDANTEKAQPEFALPPADSSSDSSDDEEGH